MTGAKAVDVRERVVLDGKNFTVLVPDCGEKTYGLVTSDGLDWLRPVLARGLKGRLAFGSRVRSLRTVNAYFVAFRNLARYLDAVEDIPTGIAELQPHHLDGFESWLRARHLDDSQEPFVQVSRVIQVLREYERSGGTGLNDRTLLRLAFTANGQTGTTQPLDAYSDFVAGALRRAARQQIDAAVERLAEGERTLADGRDPVLHGWTRPNLLWLAATEGPLQHRAVSEQAWPMIAKQYPVGDTNRSLFLTLDDVLAFWIRLSLDTGLNIESIKDLKADCLKNADRNWVHVRYIKRRRHGAEHATKRVRDGGVNTPGGLLRLAIRLTDRARQVYGSDDLWIAYGRFALTKAQITAVGQGSRKTRDVVPRFVAAHGLLGDDDQPLLLRLDRLRKTRKAETYRALKGDVALLADDHTPQVSASRYANVPSLRAEHEQAIADGLQQAQDAATTRVLIPRQEGVISTLTDASGDSATAGEKVVREVLSGERDVWVSNCSDFFNSPFGRPGQPCPKVVWGCLDCGNSIVTADRLPALIAFRRHIREQRQVLDDSTWEAMYGMVSVRIEQVLAAFPSVFVETATKIAETLDANLFIPPVNPGIRGRRAHR